MRQLWDDALGFGGAVIVRRLVGVAHVADMDTIPAATARAACERRALCFGRRLLVEGGRAAAGPRQLAALAAEHRADGAAPYFE